MWARVIRCKKGKTVQEEDILGWCMESVSGFDWPLILFTLLAGADLITWIMKNIDVEDQGLCGENLMIECFLCLNQGGGGGRQIYKDISKWYQSYSVSCHHWLVLCSSTSQWIATCMINLKGTLLCFDWKVQTFLFRISLFEWW